jgi:hypothetical protein
MGPLNGEIVERLPPGNASGAASLEIVRAAETLHDILGGDGPIQMAPVPNGMSVLQWSK